MATRTTYDPSKPITPANWPSELRMPPKRQAEKKTEKPKSNESPWDFSDMTE